MRSASPRYRFAYQRIGLRRPVLEHQAASDGSQGFLDLADMGAVVGVQKLVYGAFAHTQASGESDLGDALSAYRRVQGQLGRDDRWDGDEFLTTGGRAWSRDVLATMDTGAQDGRQCVFGHGASASA